MYYLLLCYYIITPVIFEYHVISLIITYYYLLYGIKYIHWYQLYIMYYI